jgi:hypothetical protein
MACGAAERKHFYFYFYFINKWGYYKMERVKLVFKSQYTFILLLFKLPRPFPCGSLTIMDLGPLTEINIIHERICVAVDFRFIF